MASDDGLTDEQIAALQRIFADSCKGLTDACRDTEIAIERMLDRMTVFVPHSNETDDAIDGESE